MNELRKLFPPYIGCTVRLLQKHLKGEWVIKATEPGLYHKEIVLTISQDMRITYIFLKDIGKYWELV